jgi:hypothetical protein
MNEGFKQFWKSRLPVLAVQVPDHEQLNFGSGVC